MTSLEISQVIGKPHNDVMKAIRKMEPAWESERQGKFSLTQIREEIPTADTGSDRQRRTRQGEQRLPQLQAEQQGGRRTRLEPPDRLRCRHRLPRLRTGRAVRRPAHGNQRRPRTVGRNHHREEVQPLLAALRRETTDAAQPLQGDGHREAVRRQPSYFKTTTFLLF